MKTKFLFVLAAGVFAALSVSCKKDVSPLSEEIIDAAGKDQAGISITIGSPLTKAATGESADDRISTVEVFVFDGGLSSHSNGLLENYKKVSLTSAVNTATVEMNATAGYKRIYAIVNAEEKVAASVTTESGLLAVASEFSANSPGNLIMVGGAEADLVAGSTSNISIECRRIAAKVSLQTIQGAFDSPAIAQGTFSVNKIYLMNVPKQAKYFNGDCEDAFGKYDVNRFPVGDECTPAGFIPATNESGQLPYYYFIPPAANGEAANGFYNVYSASTFTYEGGVPLSNVDAVHTLTWTAPASGTLYPAASNSTHTLNLGHDFYTYPNCSAESGSPTTVDNTTKLVLQTTLTLGNTTRTYYYSIGLPFTQPNYHYTVNNITIKRLGSENPALPVTKAECTFNITVADWETGVILGSYNNETSDGNFEF